MAIKAIAIHTSNPREKVLAILSLPFLMMNLSRLKIDTIIIANPTAAALPIIIGIVAPLTNSNALEELPIFVMNMRIICITSQAIATQTP